jgi:hypothetical protein
MFGKMFSGGHAPAQTATILPFVRPGAISVQQPSGHNVNDDQPPDDLNVADDLHWSVDQDFGRGGLQLGGLYRDRQGFGGWGSC